MKLKDIILNATINDLIKGIKKYDPSADIELIRKAYEFAKNVYKDKKTLSGDDYMQHCLNTAMILVNLKSDDKTLAAALLYDVLNSDVSFYEIEKNFGKDVAAILEGITKITNLKFKYHGKNAEEFIKLFFALAKDLRVIFIKLASRLDNLRTIKEVPNEIKKTIANESLNVYVPLANRLGIYRIKWEMEDLCMKYLWPEVYYDFKKRVAKRRVREKEIGEIGRSLANELKRHKIKAIITRRPKHFYSIWQKMKEDNKSFNEIYDLVALRVITKTIKDCYEVLGIINSKWEPIHEEFNDYIAFPKPNMYQSIHTTVKDEKGNIAEIQIRTEQMHEIAEHGIAAHWLYKESSADVAFSKEMRMVKQLHDLKSSKLLENLDISMIEEKIFIFTPTGDLIELPKGSTPVDFAYALHTELGDRCAGAKVNEKFVSLDYELHNGDVVSILTSKAHKPSREWLKFVKSEKAINKIKKSLLGTGIPAARVIKKQDVVEQEKNSLISIEGVKNPVIRLSKCCNALPGDKIIAYSSTSNRYSIHRADCDNISKLNKSPVKKLKANWRDVASVTEFKILADDRTGLLADLANTISSTGTLMTAAKAKVLKNSLAEVDLGIKFNDLLHMRDIINRIKKVRGVKKITIGKINV